MGDVLFAVVWKNLLLRRNHWVQTLREMLVPLAMLFLVNLYLPPIPDFTRDQPPLKLKHKGVESFKQYDDILLYHPSTLFTDAFTKTVGKDLGYKLINIKAGNISAGGWYDFGIEFANQPESSSDGLDYIIYLGQGVWPKSLPVWLDEHSLISSNFIWTATYTIALVQHSIDSAFIFSETGKSPPTITIDMMDKFSREGSIFGFLVIMSIFFAYVFLVAPVVTRVVEEKESGAKELMRMMGVKSWQLWLAKLLDAMMVVLFVATGMAILLFVPLTESSTVLHRVHPFIFWILLMAGMLAVVVSLFFVSCWFDSPTFAATVAHIIGVASVMLLGITEVTAVAWWKKLLYCLMPHMTLIYSAQILLKFEQYEKYVNWTERLSVGDGAMTLLEVVLMMMLDIILYAVLTWYCEKVIPGKFGVPQRWNFFLQANYWSPRGKVTADSKPLKGREELAATTAGISIHRLRKVYQVSGRPPVVAVDCVNLEAPEGRITALLGHNGAGKSTTMHMITGLIPATSGTVMIHGHDIRTSSDLARSSLGLCPQQDLLFRDLTAIQTLVFFAMIKGVAYRDAHEEAKKLLEMLKMSHAKHRNTQDLSGGMKRKLSLGIAIIGGSKVIILDEPTAGVDPELRREICDMLLSFRGVRTILLTTHIMEEADAVSDVIYIMDHGKVQCSGTPLDLKTQFGTGYTLNVVVKESGETPVMDAVKTTVPDSRFKCRNAATLTFQLPSVQTPTFPELFGKLDSMQADTSVVSYSVSISTLEDVFVRVREIEEERNRGHGSDLVDGSPYRLLSSNSQLNVTKFVGPALLLRQFYALLIKRFLTFIRSYKLYLFFTSIPFFMLLLFFVVVPQVARVSKTSDDSLRFFNYSTQMYEGMDILYSLQPSCALCREFEGPFKTLAEERGFRVSQVLNTTEAVNDIFMRDFHHYSRYLALAVDVSDEEISVRPNSQGAHVLSVGLNIISNALLGQAQGRISSSANLTFVPQPKTMESQNGPKQSAGSLPEIIGIQSLYYMNAIQIEKLHGAKGLQVMAASAWIYWLSHLLLDFFTLIPYILIITLFYYYLEPEDVLFHNSATNGGDFPMAIVLWGIGLILISYLITFFTRTRASAICVALLVYYVFSFFVWTLIATAVLPEWVAYFHPTCIWKLGIQNTGYTYLLHLLAYCVVLFCLLIFLESSILGRFFHSLLSCVCKVNYNVDSERDSDVAKEEQAVSDLIAMPARARDVLLASGLRRWYGLFRPLAAVRGVSFRVTPGECFGLLGVNGAGKSSTFNMLAGQIACSEGDAVLNRSRVASWWPDKYLEQVSYCPQSSGIIPQLSGLEFLQLFARLRGFREPQVAEAVHHWIKMLDLQDCAGSECGKYSGGMERKLSAAAAFLWDATVVMLDEPTSGVDPVARRSIWKAVTSAQGSGKSVVLTSHSMEECEALCSRLAIMVDGAFRCIGETSTLKKRFGGGYSVQLKVAASSAEEVAKLETAVLDALGPGCRLTDRHCSILHYHIGDDTTDWKTLFTRLEALKAVFPIFESYMASETTLEEIFLAFAGHRRSPNTPANVHCVEIS